MEESGGFDANFIDEPSDYFKCVVCSFVLKDPMLFVDCGHRICRTCYNDLKKHAKKGNIALLCPHDRTGVTLDKVVEDKGIARAVLDFHVLCDHVREGCPWNGELRDLERHLVGHCCYVEKDNLSDLEAKIGKRLKFCEAKLSEKDAEIASLREADIRRQNEIRSLREADVRQQNEIQSLRESDIRRQNEIRSLREADIRRQNEIIQLRKEFAETKKPSASSPVSWIDGSPSSTVSSSKTSSNSSLNDSTEQSNVLSSLVALEGYHNCYVSAGPDGSVDCTSTAIGSSERITIEKVHSDFKGGPTKVYLKSCNGKYLSMQSGRTLRWSSLTKQNSELFEVRVIAKNTIGLKSHLGRWVSAQSDGEVTVNQPKLECWEMFTVHKLTEVAPKLCPLLELVQK